MIRLYVPDRPLAAGGELVLDAARHHYLAHVLRARPGTAVELFAGDGKVVPAEVTAVAKRETRLALGAPRPGLPPAPVATILLQPLLKGGRLEWVVQKAVELGVAAISLVDVARADVRWRDADRVDRLAAVAIEAAEQCGRADVPALTGPRPLAAALAALPPEAARIVFWEEARAASLRDALAAARGAPSLALLVGPEGGLTAAEVATAEAAGFRRAGLGPRTLRAETAAVAALVAVQCAVGDIR